jgi:predicted metal-dependent hydrolase
MAKWKNGQDFKNRVRQFATEINIPIRSLTLRAMRNKWASCSTNGVLHFNTELLELDRKIGNYVIVHELLHFRAPNHGKLWKSLMTAYLGDYQAVADRLNRITTEPISR